MLDKLMLKLADLQLFKDVSSNMDVAKVEQSTRETQATEIAQFLSPELYLAMQEDYDDGTDTFNSQRFTDLWFGVDYTYQNKTQRFHGIKVAAIYYCYARMLDNGQIALTRAGAVGYTEDEVSDVPEQAQINTKVRNARSQALVYIAEANKFLKDNKSTYPEWDDELVHKKSFQMFKV